MYDIAGTTPESISVILNGNKLNIKNFEDYIKMYLNSYKEENEMRITRNNRYDKNFNYALTEGNVANQKNKLNTSVYNIKRTPKKYKLEIGQSDNFMNSVKKIFLYNNEHNKKKNFYNNIKLVDH